MKIHARDRAGVTKKEGVEIIFVYTGGAADDYDFRYDFEGIRHYVSQEAAAGTRPRDLRHHRRVGV